MNNRAIFIDKDGTLIENIPYNVDPGRIKLREGAGLAMKDLKALNFLLIIVTNQSGVARGYFTEDALSVVHNRINELLEGDGIKLDGFFYCPHHPAGSVIEYATKCECRKPKSGMIERAANQFGIDLSNSWVIGDSMDDILAGRLAGCRTILLKSSLEGPNMLESAAPNFVTRTLLESSTIIKAML